jgi:hypothetical protein
MRLRATVGDGERRLRARDGERKRELDGRRDDGLRLRGCAAAGAGTGLAEC